MLPVLKYIRRSVLALMLLLAASANCLSVTYDTNQDDDIPTVEVQFCFVASGRGAAPGNHAIDSGTQISSSALNAVQPLSVATLAITIEQGSTSLSAGSPELVVPLRR